MGRVGRIHVSWQTASQQDDDDDDEIGRDDTIKTRDDVDGKV